MIDIKSKRCPCSECVRPAKVCVDTQVLKCELSHLFGCQVSGMKITSICPMISKKVSLTESVRSLWWDD